MEQVSARCLIAQHCVASFEFASLVRDLDYRLSADDIMQFALTCCPSREFMLEFAR